MLNWLLYVKKNEIAMEEIYLSWSEFVNQYSSSEIEAKVDLNKGHAFMKLPFAPEEWRLGIKIMTFISIILLPVALFYFFSFAGGFQYY